MNRIDAKVSGVAQVQVGSQNLPADGELPAAGANVVILVRPEAVIVTPASDGDAVVETATFRGATIRLDLRRRRDGSSCVADVPSHRAAELQVGTTVSTALLERPVLRATD